MASPPARSRDATPAAASEATGHGNQASSRQCDLDTQIPSRPNAVPHSRGPISPPPLKRLGSVASSARSESVGAFTNASFELAGALTPERTAAASDGLARIPRRPSPFSSGAPTSKSRSPVIPDTSTAPMAETSRWTVPEIAERLSALGKEARECHARMTAHAIASTRATERRVFTGRDLFAGVKMTPVAEDKGRTMRIKFKQHLKAKKDHKEDEHYAPVCVKTNKDAVPPYRFHHVNIKKNILTPNTMLTFVPHLRDLEGPDEAQYNMWLRELEDHDLKSGFNPLNRAEQSKMTLRAERAATILLYLDSWLDRLAIPHCSRSTLNRFMASQEPDDAMSRQQKADRARPQQKGGQLTADERKAAEQFTAAFRFAFELGRPDRAAISLRQVLALDESLASNIDSRPAAKEAGPPEMCDIDEVVESSLASYCLLGCLICFSHYCDHGSFDTRNWKQSFSLASCSSLSNIMKRKRSRRTTANGIATTQCKRKCYRRGISSDAETHRREWTEDQRSVLRSLYITSENSSLRMDPICLAAEVLNRDCNDVFAEFDRLGIERPEAGPAEPKRPRNLPWYDRARKMLLGDWKDQTITHEYQRRVEISEPCFHAGPCAPKVCSCVDAGVLCEKFCGCTAETCAYKFTGCACHSQGKVCHAKQKDRPCICVQLNRECDPELCGSCGAARSADPLNAGAGAGADADADADDPLPLREAGCQNCELQRGAQKTLLLGRSQLDGVGYGLFTAEDIAQDEFVAEYVGELISNDEGVRRESRRGNVFDEASNISYFFTLLDHEGTWVDAAIYGNLSRYINHASEHDTRGCNITPRVLYVNGEFRIKFTALRDIEAGEELFFNYGENFPNLTKKLLDNKAAEGKPDGGHGNKPKVGRPRRTEASDRVARKAPRMEEIKERRAKTARKTVTPRATTTNPVHDHHADHRGISERRKRRLPGLRDSQKEWRPPADAAASGNDDDDDEEEEGEDDDDDDDGEKESDEVAERPAKRARRRTRADYSSQDEDEEDEDEDEEGEEEDEEEDEEESDRPPRRRIPKVVKGRDEAIRARRGRPRKDQQPAEPTPAPAPAKPTTTAAPSKSQRMVARKTEPREVIVIEDSEDDDQDVVIRTRTTRTRRMPAKFRGEEIHLH